MKKKDLDPTELELEIHRIKARYLIELKKISDFPLVENLTINQVNLSKTVLSRCYKDIKDTGFEGNVIDYLCFLSTRVILCNFFLSQDFKKVCKENRSDCKNMIRLFGKDPSFLLQQISPKEKRRIYDIVNDIRYKLIFECC